MAWQKRIVIILAALAAAAIMTNSNKAYGEEKQAGQAVEPTRPDKSEPQSTRAFSRRLGFGISVDVNLTVSPASGSNPCSTDFVLTGQIFANKATTVQYKFVRSDSKVMKPVTLKFDTPGTQVVTDTFRTADTAAASQSWAYLETVSPVNVRTRSNTVLFGGSCGGARQPER